MIDLVAELESLLVAWRAHRSPALARAIDDLSSWFELVLPAVTGESFRDRHAAWLTRASSRSVADLPELLVTFSSAVKDYFIEELEQLTMWEPDPRITPLAHRLLEQTWLSSSLSRRSWRAFLDMIERHGDPRMLPAVQHSRRMRPIFRDAERGPVVQERADAIIRYLESKVVADDPRHAALVTRIAGELALGSALRDAAGLGDAAARSVYLDWRIDRGLPPID